MVVNMLSGMKRTGDVDVLLLQGAAEPSRLAILRQLAAADDGVCACDLTACCDVAQPTVSHHLKVLRETGWVRTERRGSFIWYFLQPGAIERFGTLAGVLGGGRTPGRARALPVVQPIATA